MKKHYSHWMKKGIVAAFVLLAQIPVCAQITFKAQNKTIQQVLKQLERATGYSIFYNDGLEGLAQKVSLTANDETIDKVLSRLLKDTDITYRIENGRQIILTRRVRRDSPVTQKKRVKGVVRDSKGEPLVGVSVSVEGTTNGTVTDIDGRYQLEAAPGTRLRYSYVGFQNKSVRIGNAENYNITLTEDNTLLDEVVVVGYGTMKRKDITTAVSVVSTKDLDERPLISAAQAIQGKAAGIQVVQPSGAPGTGLSVRVRGATSVQASNEPLYVVDGMPTDNITDISPNDIESMQVLKDASSAAIYGARAANGVVLITTKRGRPGTSQIKLSAYAGISKLGRKLNALNTEEYKELMADLKKISNVAPTIPETEHRYTDWTDLFFKTGIEQNYQISIQNGSDKLQYFISGGYTDQEGIVEKSLFKRYNFRTNIDSKQNNWLNLSLNFSYAHTNGHWVRESSSAMRAGSILSVINTPPFMQKWDRQNTNWYDEQAYGSRILNPLAANAADNQTGTDYVKGSFGIMANLTTGLKWKSTFGIDLSNERWNYYLDPISTSDGRSTKGRVEESSTRNFEWLLENIITYDTSFDKHNFSLMGGATQQHAQYKGSWMAGFDLSESYPNIHTMAAANQIDKDATNAGSSAWSLASFLGRVAYNYNSKYLLTMNFRADGSSRFAKGHKWGFFPSVSAGWRFSEESFMQGLKTFIDDAKLRVGWGKNGNQGGIGNYSYLAGMNASKVAPTASNLYPGLAITANTAANKELTWEKTTQWNVGIDLMLLNGRLNFSADMYHKKTTDLLLTVSLPDNVNLPGGITRNDGEMINKGFEFNFSSQNLKGKFQWNTDFNISFNKNKLTKLGLNKIYYYGEMYETKEPAIVLKEGLPLGSFFGYISQGVDPETGNIIYADLNNNNITDPGDRTVIGNAQPDFIYGMTNTFNYKGFGLSFFLQGSQGNDIFNATRIDTEGMMDFRNQSKSVLNRWRRPGMITDIPRVGNVENIHNSTRFVEDGSYLRLKTITLSYSFDKQLIGKWGLSRLQLYATGQNLLTLTKYSGYDAEVNAYGASAVQLGIDYGTYPQSKAIILGLNVEF